MKLTTGTYIFEQKYFTQHPLGFIRLWEVILSHNLIKPTGYRAHKTQRVVKRSSRSSKNCQYDYFGSSIWQYITCRDFSCHLTSFGQVFCFRHRRNDEFAPSKICQFDYFLTSFLNPNFCVCLSVCLSLYQKSLDNNSLEKKLLEKNSCSVHCTVFAVYVQSYTAATLHVHSTSVLV